MKKKEKNKVKKGEKKPELLVELESLFDTYSFTNPMTIYAAGEDFIHSFTIFLPQSNLSDAFCSFYRTLHPTDRNASGVMLHIGIQNV